MSKISLIFPGQGAQFVGMGQEFYQTSKSAKSIFDQADQVIPGLTDVILNGPEDKLTATAYCQPGIFTMSVAALEALKEHDVYQQVKPTFSAGLSLGEYTALVAADVMNFSDALNLVKKRSQHMQRACEKSQGAMAAIIGCEVDVITRICKDTGAEVANFNTPEQTVITGEKGKVEAASVKIKEAGAKRVIPLQVGGAFHSSLMAPAAEAFEADLKAAKFSDAKFDIIQNVDGAPARVAADIQVNLKTQITSSVQWVKTIEYAISQDVTTFLEIGPGSVLKGLIRKINRDAVVYNIAKPEDIDALVEAIKS